MVDYIVGTLLLVMVGGAVAYIIKAKKSGIKCIGCPAAGNCPSKGNKTSACQCCCGCAGENCSGNTEK